MHEIFCTYCFAFPLGITWAKIKIKIEDEIKICVHMAYVQMATEGA